MTWTGRTCNASLDETDQRAKELTEEMKQLNEAQRLRELKERGDQLRIESQEARDIDPALPGVGDPGETVQASAVFVIAGW